MSSDRAVVVAVGWLVVGLGGACAPVEEGDGSTGKALSSGADYTNEACQFVKFTENTTLAQVDAACESTKRYYEEFDKRTGRVSKIPTQVLTYAPQTNIAKIVPCQRVAGVDGPETVINFDLFLRCSYENVPAATRLGELGEAYVRAASSFIQENCDLCGSPNVSNPNCKATNCFAAAKASYLNKFAFANLTADQTAKYFETPPSTDVANVPPSQPTQPNSTLF